LELCVEEYAVILIDEQQFDRKRAISPLGMILKYFEEWGERDDETTVFVQRERKINFHHRRDLCKKRNRRGFSAVTHAIQFKSRAPCNRDRGVSKAQLLSGP
jgi:hypothetical protein